MDSVVASAASMGGRTDIPRQLLEPMQRQVELLQEVIERERALQRQIAGRVLAPVDAIFDLVEESGRVLRQQAEALEEAGRALEDTSRLVKTQAEMFERVVAAMREPTELAKVAAGLERRPRKQTRRQPPKGRSKS
jgi:methyl-accepting chemotaxis protein